MADSKSESGAGLPDPSGEIIDHATFQQILEMDDDEDERDFSRSIVYDFFEQARGTFDKMDKAIKDKDLSQLSQLGHFLKGSSATLGMTKVKDSCEKIQHFGARKDETGTKEQTDDTASLASLDKAVAQAKREFEEAEKLLRNFYHDAD